MSNPFGTPAHLFAVLDAGNAVVVAYSLRENAEYLASSREGHRVVEYALASDVADALVYWMPKSERVPLEWRERHEWAHRIVSAPSSDGSR